MGMDVILKLSTHNHETQPQDVWIDKLAKSFTSQVTNGAGSHSISCFCSVKGD